MSTPAQSSASPPAPAESAPEQAPGERSGRPLLSEIGARLAKALRGLRGASPFSESLEEVIEESARQTQELSQQERMMLANLLKFGELRVEDVMVPRADIVAVEESTSFEALIEIFREAQHSRLPVYRETLDDPIGMVHIKDVLALVEKKQGGEPGWRPAPIASLRRDVIYVPGAMPALDLFLKMQASRIHLALVIDEYGGTDGLVSIEDLVEEIVGDIDDEHDVDEEPRIVARSDGSFEADARADLETFKECTGIDLTEAAGREDVDTLGGLVFTELGRVPARGEIVAGPDGFEFEVLESDARRVKRLRIRPGPAADASAAP